MKKVLLTLLAAGALCPAFAQKSTSPEITLNGHPGCAFSEALKHSGISYTRLSAAYHSNNEPVGAAMRGTGVVYDIPVVFHIVYSAGMPSYNLPDSVLTNQIQILNRAYRKQNADTGSIRTQFRPLSADAQIQFHLATTDPAGMPTTGVTRTLSPLNHFGPGMDIDSTERVKSTARGGIDPWPESRYLNIWVCNISDGIGQVSVLGYGIPPLHPLPPNWQGTPFDTTMMIPVDGVVVQTHAVGSNNPIGAALAPYYTRGRALIHEVGHYLGLAHEFGLGDGVTANCGTPEQSDGIDDTPEQGTSSLNGGAAPAQNKNSCGSGSTDSVDLWEDYMDYTADVYQTMFTRGQVQLMRSVLANQRSGLTNSSASVTIIGRLSEGAVYPNPASSAVSLSYPGQPARVVIVNVLGMEVAAFTGTQAASKTYDVSSLPPGQYILRVASGNGQVATGRFVILR